MEDFKPIVIQDQRVLLTSQLAESYETTERRISENFNRNRCRYEKGKHYFCLTGAEKRDFINRTQIADGSKKAGALYLWTKRGAAMHAKSLDTDRAWDLYSDLVDNYFLYRGMPGLQNASPFKLIAAQAEAMADLETKVSMTFHLAESTQNTVRELTATQAPLFQRIKDIAKKNHFSPVKFIGKLYTELEQSKGINLSLRLKYAQQRSQKSGAKYKVYHGITKLDVINEDAVLKKAFEDILKKYEWKEVKKIDY